jgi:hypothetical protein
MSVSFPPTELRDALNGDPEFRLAARFWNGAIEFRIGEQRCVVNLAEGAVIEVGDSVRGAAAPVVISAPEEDWAELLEPAPRPFYQDFHAASAHHGFRLGGDVETLWAYYAAVRRSADILRAIAVVERGQE